MYAVDVTAEPPEQILDHLMEAASTSLTPGRCPGSRSCGDPHCAAAWAAGRHHALVVGPRSHLPPRDDEGMVRGARRVHPALRHRRPRWVRAADAADEVRGSHRPLWLSTLDAISTELVSDSLVHRYKAAASPDGLEGDEATFPLCSFCTSPRWRVPVASM